MTRHVFVPCRKSYVPVTTWAAGDVVIVESGNLPGFFMVGTDQVLKPHCMHAPHNPLTALFLNTVQLTLISDFPSHINADMMQIFQKS
jgi:hypothetical protein